jgi:adenylate cyclase class 2
MAIEVEFKAWVDDPDALESALKAQAEFVRVVQKYDIYFSQPDHSETHFRLRREAANAIVTTKYKTIMGGTEISDEIEFNVSDPQAFCRFIDRFGFEPFVVKRKTGRIYRAGNATLELNEVEHLGSFIEVEIMCEDESFVEEARNELDEWARRLGIARSDIEPTPYIILIQQRHPARYVFDHSDSEALVREVPLRNAGR